MKDLLNKAKQLDGLKIKRVFECSPIEKNNIAGLFFSYTCEIKERDGDNTYSMDLYGGDRQGIEDMRNRAMFGLNDACKQQAENERLRALNMDLQMQLKDKK